MRKRIGLEHVSEFKYLGCVFDESGTDQAECSRKVASGRRDEGAIRSLVNARSLQLDLVGGCMNHYWCLLMRMVVRQ